MGDFAKIANILIATMVLASCSTEKVGELDQRSESSSTVEDASPVVNAHPYVAIVRLKPSQEGNRPKAAMLALNHGQYAIRNGCLVFGQEEYWSLPGFLEMPDIQQSMAGLTINGVLHPAREVEQLGGGEVPPERVDLLQQPPAQCPYRLWMGSR